MKLEEAIKHQKHALRTHPRRIFPDFYDATKLGIEALKQIKIDRRNRLPFRAVLLLGETE